VDHIPLCLAAAPIIIQLGLNQHGRVAEERFRMRALYGLHLYHYHGWVEVDGTRHAFAPGAISITPPNADLRWHFPRRAAHHYAHLRLSTQPDLPQVCLPIITPVADAARYEALRKGFEIVIANHQVQPGRTAAWMWELLWSLAPVPCPSAHPACAAAGTVAGSGGRLHPALHTALSCIEDNLDGRLELGALAAQVCLSKTHLIRLFQGHCGTTVMGWIRQRRMERARQLLRDSSMPIQAVAAAVGIPDLQRFNKLIRRHWGRAPRMLRGEE
jgi:AraC-like DNA-binding protein